MNNDAFKAIVGELGQVKTWSKEQASTLLDKAKSVFGDGRLCSIESKCTVVGLKRNIFWKILFYLVIGSSIS